MSDYVTRDELYEIAHFIKDAHNNTVKELKADLAKRLLWRGSWKAGETCRENDMCHDKNAIHVCTATASQARPGNGAGWRTLAHFRAGLK